MKPFPHFPAVLLTVIGSLNCSPASWSIQDTSSSLSCSLTWSPVSLDDSANDSGYESPEPASPNAPSPVRPSAFNLDVSLDSSFTSQTNPHPTTTDAATETSNPPVSSTTSQTSTFTTCISTSTFDLHLPTTSSDFCCQTSTNTPIYTSDAATGTSNPPVSSTTSQTSTFTTCTSTSTFDLNSPPTLSDFCCQTSTDTQIYTSDAATETTPPPPPTTTTSAIQTDPVKTTNLTTSKKKRSRKSKPKPTTTLPSFADASTSYEPPPIKPVLCRFCGDNVPANTPALAHLFGCEEGPVVSQQLRDGLLNDFSESTGLEPETLATMIELHLTKYRPDDIEPTSTHASHSDFLIGQLLFRAIDYDTLLKLHDNLVHLCTDYTTRACHELQSDSLLSLYRPYPDIETLKEPSLEDLEEELEAVRYHPFDDLVEFPTEDEDYEDEDNPYLDYI